MLAAVNTKVMMTPMMMPRKRSSRVLQSRSCVQAGRRQLMGASGERLPVNAAFGSQIRTFPPAKLVGFVRRALWRVLHLRHRLEDPRLHDRSFEKHVLKIRQVA